jgi:serine/threonine protein kinase/Flp pilus assembly protein TadD
MTTPTEAPNVSAEVLMGQVVEEFLDCLNRGEQPEVESYVRRYPQLASVLRQMLPALELMRAPGVDLAAESEPSAPLSLLEGCLGDFRITREIGRGGMGVVYEAEQLSLDRRVALKVLPFAAALDARQLQRFKNEAQAAAHLHHTNIVPVYAVGSERGVHYYAMQFIEGQTLAALITELRQLAGRESVPERAAMTGPAGQLLSGHWAAASAGSAGPEPTGPYGPEAAQTQAGDTTLSPAKPGSARQAIQSPAFFRIVAQLGIQAAEALEHAHQLGVVHRDIKPGNLLLEVSSPAPSERGGEVPRLWITDFGLAFCQSQAGLSMTGDLVGTLRYMSPEQAMARRVLLDHRTDIYSLGATLYELLTLEPAFNGRDREELLRQIAFEEPQPARRLNQAIPRELETIVGKAMEKNPAERYSTAQELADDLGRYLKDEPIRARRPTLVQRAQKWCRRHKAAVWAAGVCLSVTLLVLAVSIGWAVRDREAQWTTTAQQVNLALNEAGVLHGQQKWREALGAVRPAEALLANGGGDAALHNRVRELRKDLEMAARLDELRLQKNPGGDASFGGGDARTAIEYAREFEGYGIRVLTDPPERVAASIQVRSIREQLVAVLDDWILVQTDAGVRERLRTVLKLADANEWPNRMRKAVIENDRRALEELACRPEVPGFPPTTAHLLGQALAHAGAGQRAVQVLAAAQQRHPQDFWLNYQLGIQLLWGPDVQHNPAAAAGYLRAALVARPDYPTVYTYLAIALQGPKHLHEKIALNRKAIELDPDYYSAHGNLGLALLHQGKSVEAEVAFREVLRLRPNEPRAHAMLGDALRNQGRLAEAEVEYREALRRRPDYPEAHIGLGLARLEQGKPAEAEAEFREALRLKQDLPEGHYNLGIALLKQERRAEAEAEFREAMHLKPDFPKARCNLGTTLAEQGKYAAAEAEFREALRLKPDYPEAHYNLGHVLMQEGRFAEALDALRRGHELGSRQPKWRHPSAEWVRQAKKAVALDARLSQVLQGQAQPADAVERLALARLCQNYKKRFAAAARFHAEAFDAEPKLANDLRHPHRYNAACSAALAGCGQGMDSAQLGDVEQSRLRRQALSWLRADLAAWDQLVAKVPDKSRAVVQQALRHWQQDSDFAGVRGDGLARLPEAERQPWRQLWTDVEKTLKKANRSDTEDNKKESSK